MFKKAPILKCTYCSIVIRNGMPHCVARDSACSHVENICTTCQRQGKHLVNKRCMTCNEVAPQWQAAQSAKPCVDIFVEVAGYSEHYITQFLDKIVRVKASSHAQEIYHIQGEKKYRFIFGDGKPEGAMAKPDVISLYCVHCCDSQHAIEKQTQSILPPILLKATKAVVLAIHPSDTEERYRNNGMWVKTVRGQQCMIGQAMFVTEKASMLHVLLDDIHLMRYLLSHLVDAFNGVRKHPINDKVVVSGQAVLDAGAMQA